jgi:hypothetical protein
LDDHFQSSFTELEEKYQKLLNDVAEERRRLKEEKEQVTLSLKNTSTENKSTSSLNKSTPKSESTSMNQYVISFSLFSLIV